MLSFEQGAQKLDRRLCRAALDELGLTAVAALIMRDRASGEGGVAAGVATLLPPATRYGARGLGLVLGLVGR